MNGNPPHVAVAILNFNGKEHLEKFLPSVSRLSYPNTSVWVIDNHSTDDSAAWVLAHYPQVKWVQNGANLGFAEGYNRGLSGIDADYFWILNSDVEVEPGALDPMVAYMEAHRETAFCQPKMLAYRQRQMLEYAGAGGGFIDALGYPFCRGRLFEHTETDAGQYDDELPVFWATGAAMLARANAFRELGGFYPFFFMHNEEIDLCWRAQNRGWQIGYCGKSRVYHLGGASLNQGSPRKTYFNFRNNLVMLMRNMPVMRLVWVLPIRFALDLVAALRSFLSGDSSNGAAVLKAWTAFLSWCLWRQPGKWPGTRGFRTLQGIYSGSIVWQYFALGKRTIRP